VTRLPALLAALAVLLLVAACGGESKGDVISEGDRICREANEKLADLKEPEEISGLPGYAREALPIVEDAVADLKALDPPDQDREAFDEFIERSEELEDLLKELEASGSGTTDAELEQASERIGQVTQESNVAAEEYGFEDCAEE
jgi:hypothetical protein